MKTIGILGGLSPESTIAYYSYITRKYYDLYSDYAYPEILIHSFKFSEFIESGYRLPDKVRTAIRNLHRAGADFVVAACNSVHIVYDEVSTDIPIPWISIMDAVAEEIRNRGVHEVALIGTVFTMDNDFYHKAFARYDIETITPDRSGQQRINEIIYGELVKAEIRDDSRRAVLGIIDECVEKRVEPFANLGIGGEALDVVDDQKILTAVSFVGKFAGASVRGVSFVGDQLVDRKIMGNVQQG